MTLIEIKMENRLVGLAKCPHCGVANPEMAQLWRSDCILPRGVSSYGHNWAAYRCTSCNFLVLAQSQLGNQSTNELLAIFPEVEPVAQELPNSAKRYLEQAIGSLHAPDGAAMLAGSAVDAMLKEKGLTKGSVYNRIDEAVVQKILTQDMAEWAHEVRLGSNRPRHADIEDPHTTVADARQSVEFAKTLGHVLFVLPSRVALRGRGESKGA